MTWPRNTDHVVDHHHPQSWSNITSGSKEWNSFKKQLWWKQQGNSLPISHEFREYLGSPRILTSKLQCNIMSSERADFKKLVDDPVTYATGDHLLPSYKICIFMCSWVVPFKGLVNCIQSLNGFSSSGGLLSPWKSFIRNTGPSECPSKHSKHKTRTKIPVAHSSFKFQEKK